MSEIRTSDQVNEIYTALAKAQAKLENITKDRENPHFRQKYATLAGVLGEVRPKLSAEGIAVIQMPVNGEGSNVGIVTRLTHSSGQWIESALYVQPTKFDAQGVGSVLTYLRRYSLMAVAGVGPEDDDGNAAVGRPEARPQTNGITRTASAPTNGSGINKSALPASPEETPEITAARQRIRMLIDKYDHVVKTAPHKQALELALDDARDELAEIEAAGENGKQAAMRLRQKATARLAQFDEAA